MCVRAYNRGFKLNTCEAPQTGNINEWSGPSVYCDEMEGSRMPQWAIIFQSQQFCIVEMWAWCQIDILEMLEI